MKTTQQLFAQEKRLNSLIWQIGKREMKRADPDTDGNPMLVNNWGNEASKRSSEKMYNRLSRLFHVFREKYNEAFALEYPNHLMSKRYLSEKTLAT